MEIEDIFEEWDDSEMIDIEELEDLSYGEQIDENETSKDEGSDSEAEESDNEDESDDDALTKLLRCKKCRKVYRMKSWFLKHQTVCDGASSREKTNRQKSSRMSQHQLKTREVLANLEVDDYFFKHGLPMVLKMLDEIRQTSADTAATRGLRYVDMKPQAEAIYWQLHVKNSKDVYSTGAESFLTNVTSKLWEIIFAKDYHKISSTRQRYVAQHLTEYRSSRLLIDSWTEVLRSCGINSSNGKLLLQKIITAVYEDISEFRTTSVTNSLEIIDKYQGETHNESNLTSAEKSIISYIAGYVCRKTRDTLLRYCGVNKKSTTAAVVDKCRRLAEIANAINTNVNGVEKHAPALSYPNLITLSLNRGGLTVIDALTFDFFCCLETSIRPFLNLANFRSSTRKSDKDLLEQLIDNTPKLLEIFPYSSLLCYKDSMLLLNLFCDLFYRARKWAYLKVYKEHKKFSKILHVNSSSVDLHGKDSIRKALLCNTINTSS